MNVKMAELILIDGVQFSAGDVLYKHKTLGHQVGDNEFELTPEGAVELGFSDMLPAFPLGTFSDPEEDMDVDMVFEEVVEKPVKIDKRLKANRGK